MNEEAKQQYFDLKMRWIINQAQTLPEYAGTGAVIIKEQSGGLYHDPNNPSAPEMDAALSDVELGWRSEMALKVYSDMLTLLTSRMRSQYAVWIKANPGYKQQFADLGLTINHELVDAVMASCGFVRVR